LLKIIYFLLLIEELLPKEQKKTLLISQKSIKISVNLSFSWFAGVGFGTFILPGFGRTGCQGFTGPVPQPFSISNVSIFVKNKWSNYNYQEF
jgi:hypothetical protein